MTHAQTMLSRWLNDLETIESVEGLAREIDPRCHIHSFLYSDRKRIVFCDYSQAQFANHTLEVIK